MLALRGGLGLHHRAGHLKVQPGGGQVADHEVDRRAIRQPLPDRVERRRQVEFWLRQLARQHFRLKGRAARLAFHEFHPLPHREDRDEVQGEVRAGLLALVAPPDAASRAGELAFVQHLCPGPCPKDNHVPHSSPMRSTWLTLCRPRKIAAAPSSPAKATASAASSPSTPAAGKRRACPPISARNGSSR